MKIDRFFEKLTELNNTIDSLEQKYRELIYSDDFTEKLFNQSMHTQNEIRNYEKERDFWIEQAFQDKLFEVDANLLISEAEKIVTKKRNSITPVKFKFVYLSPSFNPNTDNPVTYFTEHPQKTATYVALHEIQQKKGVLRKKIFMFKTAIYVDKKKNLLFNILPANGYSWLPEFKQAVINCVKAKEKQNIHGSQTTRKKDKEKDN